MPDEAASRDVILTEMRDGTGVLLDLRSKFYFTLNTTGVAVWKLLASGEATTAPELAGRIGEYIERLVDTKMISTLTTPALMEQAVAWCLEQGLLRRHAAHRHAAHRELLPAQRVRQAQQVAGQVVTLLEEGELDLFEFVHGLRPRPSGPRR